jgi:DNA-binding MarR family transcriptional regulator
VAVESINAEAAELRRRLARRDLAAARFRAATRKRLRLDDSTMLAFMQLAERDSLTAGELGALVALSSGGMAAALHRLDTGHWIEREPNPRDGRSVLIRLSPSGVERATDLYRALTRDLEALAAELTPELRTALARFLTRASAITERHADLLLRSPQPRSAPVPALWA